jgi:hypothetical protein
MGDLTIDYSSEDFDPIEYNSETFLTSFGNVTHQQANNMSTELANQSFMHAITAKETTKELLATKEQLITKETEQNPFVYINTFARYTSKEFYGVMIDTGASCRSTAGYEQYLAYKKNNNKDIEINTIQAGAVNVQFGIGSTLSIGTIIVNTPIGNIDFHVIQADTPFLLSFKNIL